MRSRTAEAIASTPRWSPSRTVASSATLPAQRFHGREAELRDALLGWRVQLAEWLHVGGAQLRVVAHRIDHRLDLAQRAHGRIDAVGVAARAAARRQGSTAWMPAPAHNPPDVRSGGIHGNHGPVSVAMARAGSQWAVIEVIRPR